jgi:hypothetical protein
MWYWRNSPSNCAELGIATVSGQSSVVTRATYGRFWATAEVQLVRNRGSKESSFSVAKLGGSISSHAGASSLAHGSFSGLVPRNADRIRNPLVFALVGQSATPVFAMDKGVQRLAGAHLREVRARPTALFSMPVYQA